MSVQDIQNMTKAEQAAAFKNSGPGFLKIMAHCFGALNMLTYPSYLHCIPGLFWGNQLVVVTHLFWRVGASRAPVQIKRTCAFNEARV
jgi:hypothetical protein